MIKTQIQAVALAVGALVATPTLALDLENMTESERNSFQSEIRGYLLENPEIIMEAVAVLEQRRAEMQAQADIDLVRSNANALFNDDYSWVGGNLDGDVTLVEFMDYRCGYCRRAVDDVHALLEEDQNIRFIIKEYPILGEASTLSSRFAIATKQIEGDEAYKAIHDALIAFNGDINDRSLRRLGDALGLDSSEIIDHMDSDEVSQVIAANYELARSLGISGTPSFVMEEQLLRGYLPKEAMQQMANEIRSN